jgi:hypothetical protein
MFRGCRASQRFEGLLEALASNADARAQAAARKLGIGDRL